jgi:hypothetical protein
MALTPENFVPTQHLLPDAQMREILGEEDYLKYKEYKRGGAAYRMVRDAAMTVAAATRRVQKLRWDSPKEIIRSATSL